MTDLPAVTSQPITLIAGLWSCSWCAAQLNNSVMIHRQDCRWIAEIAAVERQRIAAADPTTETEGFRAYKAGAAAEREKIRAAIADEYGPSEARKMRRVLLGDTS